MNAQPQYWFGVLDQLGRRMDALLADAACDSVLVRAAAANPWFTLEDIRFALHALRTHMLDAEVLREWFSHYEFGQQQPANVALILAGNIPLVGFHDLMCVLVAGHIPFVKPSSKDTILIEWVIDQLRNIDSQIIVRTYSPEVEYDAAIVSGSDNTERLFRAHFASIPTIIRGSRNSAAIISGAESECQIRGLAQDMFRYSGLGCRNVSLLMVPHDCDLQRLAAMINSAVPDLNPKFINNYRHLRAKLTAQGEQFVDCGCFVMTENDDFQVDISNIAVVRYDSAADIADWFARHERQLQCVVGGGEHHPRSVDFGSAQLPFPWDYPDGIDTLQFLLNLHKPESIP